MKILRVFDAYRDRNLHYFLMERMTLLNSSEFNIQAVYLDKKSGDVPEEYQGVKLHLLTNKKIGHSNLFIILKLAKLINREKIDIIHCDNYKGIFYGVLASFFCKDVKIVCLMHGLNRCRNWKRKLFFYIFGKRIDLILGCSGKVVQDIKQYPDIKPSQIKVLPNSINLRKFDGVEKRMCLREDFGLNQNDFVFIFVGRLVETKGLDYLIEAFQNVAKKFDNARLLLVGDGRLKNKLKGQASKGVVFAGFRTDVGSLLKMSDCFVLSSIREGMPLSIFEAMITRLPIITTNTGAVEQVRGEDGEQFGFLCPVADSKALADKMMEAIEMDEASRKDLTDRAAKRVEKKYSHSVAVDNLKALYTEVHEG